MVTLSQTLVQAIQEILDRGNSVTVKKRKDDIIVIEDKSKIKASMPLQ